MTVSNIGGEERLIILPDDYETSKTINTFTLPPPSNITSKPRIELFEDINGKLYEIRSFQFGKGPSYSHEEDLANDKYHYTKENHPIKSTFIVNTSDPTDGYVFNSSKIHFCSLYDIAFSLIGFYYRNSVSADEQDYSNSSDTGENQKSNSKTNEKFLTVRDYHDFLTDSHDKNWENISLSRLKSGLAKVSETIEEAGDVYYKITSAMITQFLLGKVSKIVENFPPSIPTLKNAPTEINQCYKVVMATNLLVSLIPRAAYHNLLTFSPTMDSGCLNLDIKASFIELENYETTNELQNAERELLMKSAMNVGLNLNGSVSLPVKKVTKKIVQNKKPKVAIGKGAIDGFFKRK
ncbi:CEL_1a_G0011270.mRNA.1.CDS.1 [Saccharomyces cerevisiae]|nr:CEL_1a_G0011270.mRNA.1.CDS.1 [Saccharomyces cerevisiae]CAI7211758.1 CEL_1a_G0011270.mRNA.1.CDS.1 [Saccharomyces cerevisiae]